MQNHPPHFPPEIYGRIAMWACTDGGTTARSLSLVSRFISSACSAHKLQSVALSGSHSLHSFFTTVRDKKPTDRQVQHLLLSDRRLGKPLENEDDAERLVESLRKQISILFSLIARHIQTLSLIFYGPQPGALLTAAMLFPLPMLERLWVRITVPPTRTENLLPDSYTIPCLPKLASLSVSLHNPFSRIRSQERDRFQLPCSFASACPALKRIELLGLNVDVSLGRGGDDTTYGVYCLISREEPPPDIHAWGSWFASHQERQLAPHLPANITIIRLRPIKTQPNNIVLNQPNTGATNKRFSLLTKMVEAARQGRPGASVKILKAAPQYSYHDWKQMWVDNQAKQCAPTRRRKGSV